MQPLQQTNSDNTVYIANNIKHMQTAGNNLNILNSCNINEKLKHTDVNETKTRECNKENFPEYNNNCNDVNVSDTQDNIKNQSNDESHRISGVSNNDNILHDNSSIVSDSTITNFDTNLDSDSVTDADSAIMLEDTCSDSLVIFPFMRDGVKVIRSVSDALECSNRHPLSVANGPCGDLDSCDNTPVNSPTGSPRLDNKNRSRNSLSYQSNASSVNTSRSCSSNEDSDSSPVCTLSKARSSSLQSVQDAVMPTTKVDSLSDSENKDKLTPANQETKNTHLSLADILQNNSVNDNSEVMEMTNDKNGNTVFTNPLEQHLPNSMLVNLDHTIDSEYLSSLPSDSDVTISDPDTDDDNEEEDCDFTHSNIVENSLTPDTGDRRLLLGSYEKLSDIESMRPRTYKKKPDELIQVTYNRVMSNHRSVTKVKDVKYRRINKAKSRSLEELRGKLRTHEGKPLISVSIGHSYA